MLAINTSSTNLKISGNVKETKQAFYLAEAGISHAAEFLNQNLANWDTYASPQPLISTTNLGAGSYSVTIEDAGDKRRRLVSTGSTGGGAKAQIEVIFEPSYFIYPFPKGLHGCDGVTVESNGMTSSYSSSGATTDGKNGDIGTSNPDADIILESNSYVKGNVSATGDLTLESNAKIEKDALATGDIDLSTNTKVFGDAKSSKTIHNSGTIVGNSEDGISPDVVPSVECDPLDITAIFDDVESSMQAGNDNGDLSGSGHLNSDVPPDFDLKSNYTLGASGASKEYYFGNFSTNSNRDITIQGNVTLYVNGNFSTASNSNIILAAGATLTIYVTGTFIPSSNGRINNQGKPSNVMIYSSAESTGPTNYKVDLSSNSGTYAVIYAPNAAIKVSSNGSIGGAVRGRYVDLKSNGAFSYDEDLGNLPFDSTIPTGCTKILWREIN